MLLIGYVEKHKETCQEEDCPLKLKRQKRKNAIETEMEETCQNLLKVLKKNYILSVCINFRKSTECIKTD